MSNRRMTVCDATETLISLPASSTNWQTYELARRAAYDLVRDLPDNVPSRTTRRAAGVLVHVRSISKPVWMAATAADRKRWYVQLMRAGMDVLEFHEGIPAATTEEAVEILENWSADIGYEPLRVVA